MNARLVVGVISFGVMMTSAFLGNLYFWKMVEAINRRRPDGEKIDHFQLPRSKGLLVFMEYRTLYPDGKYADYARNAAVSMFISMFVTAACAGIIPTSC
jgi:hypothetical protein